MGRTRVALVDTERERALTLADGWRDAGDDIGIVVIGDETGLACRIAGAAADVVLIDLANPSRDALERIAAAAGPLDRPVPVFVDRTDPETTRAAIEEGASADVVDGRRTARVRPILGAASARVHAFARRRAELAATTGALAARKVIGRGEGLPMMAKAIGEEATCAPLRRPAMERGRKRSDITRSLVYAADLLT